MIFKAILFAILVAGVVASPVEQLEACTYTVAIADMTSTVLDGVSVGIGFLGLLIAILQLQQNRRMRPRL